MAYECTDVTQHELVLEPGKGYVWMWSVSISFDEWSDLGPAIKELVLPMLETTERDYGWEMCMAVSEDGRHSVICSSLEPDYTSESEDDEWDGDSLGFGPY
mgnify:CR=1 FL=1